MDKFICCNTINAILLFFCAMMMFSSCRKVYYDVPYINAYYHADSYRIQDIKECSVEGKDYMQIRIYINDISNTIEFMCDGFDAISKRHNDNIRRSFATWKPSYHAFPENDLVKVYFDGQPSLTSHTFFTSISWSTYVSTEKEFDYNTYDLSPFSKIEYDFDGKRMWHPVENYLDRLSPNDLFLLEFDFMGGYPYAVIYIPKEELPDDELILVLVDVHNQEFKLQIPSY